MYKLLICLCLVSCHKYEVVRQSITPIPEDVNGVLYVATNKPIAVGVEATDIVLSLDVGGYYLIHKNDLTALLKAVKDAQAGKR